MDKIKKLGRGIISFLRPEGSDIQTSAFIILAVCGTIVCVIAAINSLFVEPGMSGFWQNTAGVFISLGLLIYTKKTGNYRLAIVLTIIIIFLGLFTFLFFSGGGYHSGMPAFFIFAVVFTAFMLRGILMPVFVMIELAWYTAICLYVYNNPEAVTALEGEDAFLTDVIVCMIVVSISLALTMYFQIRVYRKKQQELNVAMNAADEANKAKSDFLAKMSHDIRTPLNTIMAMNEMIVTNTSSPKIREWANDSNLSGRILISLIDDMLDLTKIEVGKIKLLDRPFNARHLFNETAKIWKPQVVKAGLDFELDVDDAIPDYLSGDEDMVRKIINNLLSNAVKYTRKGRVSLKAGWDDKLIIEVTDTGVGIAPEFIEQIFKPFERGVQEIYKETSGSGLGLAIVSELVDTMEGTIECKSCLDEGTTFIVNLPLKEYKDKEETVQGAAGEEGKNDEKAGKTRFIAPNVRILVVDDNQFNRKVIKLFLEPALIHIDEVESGYEALEMIDIREYDLILMDLRMPKMDGAETLEKIKSEYPDFATPVIVLTADIMDGVEERLLSQGFAAFLPKPVIAADLLDMITRFLPDKVVTIEAEQEEGMTLARIESCRKRFLSCGIDLNMALENNAGKAGEFMSRVRLFDEYADENMNNLRDPGSGETYYLQVHAVKSIAKGVGAYLLAQLTETVELRHDAAYSEKINPMILDEYERVRDGLKEFMEEMEAYG
ncbi:MAG: response regulator [Lachnospiraceae bacterium]|nr:response regulator [Lachnospiraceae bacterium]